MVETIQVTSAETRVKLARGESVRLCLAESPTTGFVWSRRDALPAGLVEVESTFVPGGPGMGAGGLRCFIYRAAGSPAAEAAIAFVLARPWEPSEPAETRRVVFDLAPG